MTQYQSQSRIEQRKAYLAATSQAEKPTEPTTIVRNAKANYDLRDVTRCPQCGQRTVRVLESRNTEAGVRRRKQCHSCSARFTTQEIDQQQFDEMKAALNTLEKIQQLFQVEGESR